MSGKKTDNSHLGAKLSLRRYMLRKYHADGDIRVLDCCQGTGKIWDILRREFPIKRYWGLDLKPRTGRLKVDSARVLGLPGLTDNVIDIDTYGKPWQHWNSLTAVADHACTVFLTIGHSGVFGICGEELAAVGLGNILPKVPKGITLKLGKLSLSYCLTTSCSRVKLIEAVEAVTRGNARYLAVRIEPLAAGGLQ